MSQPVSSSATSTQTPSDGAPSSSNEEDLRRMLRVRLRALDRREPLDPTYRYLLPGAIRSTGSGPAFPRDKLYRKMGSDLRERVEAYAASAQGLGGRKRGRQRDDLEDGPMRAAFTLRESKKHEQEALVAASLAAPPMSSGGRPVPPGMDETARRRWLEAMAVGLQERDKKEKAERARLAAAAQAKILLAERERAAAASMDRGSKTSHSKASLADRVRHKKEEEVLRREEERKRREEREREIEERERARSLEKARERERQREAARKKEQEEEKRRAERAKEEELRRARMAETPQQALHRLYEPIFRVLWDMEFAILHGTNPFRIVIDKENCAAMGVPDYCDVIQQPMNLTYIQEKVNKKEYETLQAFFADVELMLNNALLYNSDPNNEFHLAAKEMKKKYKKLAKRVVQSVKQQHQQQQAGSSNG